jgi:hypothetical protein
MVEKLLELGCDLAAVVRGQIRFTAQIDGIQTGRESRGTRRDEFVGSGSLKNLNGLRGIVAVERELSPNRGKVVELHDSIIWPALGQIIGPGMYSGRVACKGQR